MSPDKRLATIRVNKHFNKHPRVS